MKNEASSDMNMKQTSEWQAQERALEQARSGVSASGDVRIDAYRVAFHAVAQAPRSEPPLDFVERTLRAVREAEVDEHIERWMVRIAGLIGVVALVVFAGPVLIDSLQSSTAWGMLPGAGLLGSPLLWATASGVVTAGLMDSWQSTRHVEPIAHS